MVSVTDMKIITERWKKGIRPLKIQDMEYGNKVVRMLEKYKGDDFRMFDDPLEVTTFILLVGMLREQDQNNREPTVTDTILPCPEMKRNSELNT
jgi:hypothetical protein